MSNRILLIEDDSTFRRLLSTILHDEGYDVQEAERGDQALALLRATSFDLVISDLKLPGLSGLEIFRQSRDEPLPPPFLLLTAYGTVEEAVAAMKEGVVDFLTKPLKDPAALRQLVARILASNRREREYRFLKDREVAGLPPQEVLFAGAAMEGVRRLITEVAPTTATVLLSGESGTGKELVARFTHYISPRSHAPFVPINCAALPEQLLESELFGHERGAFTGAIASRPGKFEVAQGGSIFLDEIGEMPLPLQAKLLRVLQERSFERVGGNRQIRADVRVIAASNRQLDQEVREKRFREDLFYRLNVFPVTLPPLRDRRDAIPLLTNWFVGGFCRQLGKVTLQVSTDAQKAMARYSWPGNIRELQNVMERAVILSQRQIGMDQLPEVISNGGAPLTPDTGSLEQMERITILETLKECSGNRRITAERLGISRRTLQYRLRHYGIVSDD